MLRFVTSTTEKPIRLYSFLRCSSILMNYGLIVYSAFAKVFRIPKREGNVVVV